MNRLLYIFLLAFAFLLPYRGLAQEKKEGGGNTLTAKQMRAKKKMEKARLKEEARLQRKEKKRIEKHHKRIQSKETLKQMKRGRKKAAKKNRKNTFG